MSGPKVRIGNGVYANDRDVDAARYLLGGLGSADDDYRLFYTSGGRLPGVSSCIHTMVEYGEAGAFRHHVYTPIAPSDRGAVGAIIPCHCGFDNVGPDGRSLHQSCWITMGGN